ncbi:unnamed protein product [Pleuronectes platessa]|uniref:Uncharacterized protein n=1 Tax=Pleuronectes platessa TaxID=8262 RepID=A0A9N7TZI6_PLEPL|nr:unnamed protein product [Pleuronectes platessa]
MTGALQWITFALHSLLGVGAPQQNAKLTKELQEFPPSSSLQVVRIHNVPGYKDPSYFSANPYNELQRVYEHPQRELDAEWKVLERGGHKCWTSERALFYTCDFPLQLHITAPNEPTAGPSADCAKL